MSWKDSGVYVEVKFDGTAVQIHRDSLAVAIISEDGQAFGDNLPTLSQELLSMGEDTFVVAAELEAKKDGKHIPRAVTAGILNSKGPVPEEKFIFANVYDILFHNGKDLHALPYSERLNHLRMIKDSEHFIKNSRTLVKSEEEVRREIKKYASIAGSEGAMLKLASFKYELDRQTLQTLKFKIERQLYAEVVRVQKVSGSEKTFLYYCAMKGPKGLHFVGKTFNTNINADVGDILLVSFEDISAYTDPSGKKWARWYVPHVIEKAERTVPDSIEKAWKIAEQTSGRFEEKPEPKMAEFSKQLRFVAQLHWRGSTGHIDFRTEVKDYLEGFTLAPQKKDLIIAEVNKHLDLKSEDGIESIYFDGELFYQYGKNEKIIKKPTSEQYRKIYLFYKSIVENPKFWKMDLNTGNELIREDGKEKIYAVKKAPEPKEWISIEGATPPLGASNDMPGGTRKFPGVFVEIDSGTYVLGAKKPYYIEYFLYGSKWKGRIVFRQVAGLEDTKQPLTWLYWRPDEQKPYVLDKRAIKEEWLPEGYSALPKEIESKIPDNLNYWKSGISTAERLERRKVVADKYAKKIKQMSALELDFIKPLKPFKDENKTNEFFSVDDLKDFNANGKIIEPKFDGIRMQVHKKGNSVKFYSAWGHQFQQNRLGYIPEQIKQMYCYDLVLDGELVIPGGDHDDVHEAVTTNGSDKLEFMVFDILHAHGNNLSKKPLEDRKRYLGKVPDYLNVRKVEWKYADQGTLIPIIESYRRDHEGAVIKDLKSTYFEPEKLWKVVFMEKQLKDLDKISPDEISEMKIVLDRCARKLEEGKRIPISSEELASRRAKVEALLKSHDFSNEFVLSRRHWKGQDVVRKLEVEDWHIKFGSYRFHLDYNPIDYNSSANEFKGDDEYFKQGRYEPGSVVNENKKIPVFIEVLDRGQSKIIRNEPEIIQVKFSGKYMKGLYMFRRTSSKDPVWSMLRQKSPGADFVHNSEYEKESELIKENRKKEEAKKPHKFKPAEWTFPNGHPRCLVCGDEEKTGGVCDGLDKKSITFSFKDFMVRQGQKHNKLAKDIKFPYRGRAIAFAEGTWHNTKYTWDVIRVAAPKLVGKQFTGDFDKFEFKVDSIKDGSDIVIEHSEGVLENVGNVTSVFIDDTKKQIEIEFELIDTSSGRDVALLLENEKIPAVSVRLEELTDYINGVEVCSEITGWPHVALVTNPAVDRAIILESGSA